jgi:hypothetical protein
MPRHFQRGKKELIRNLLCEVKGIYSIICGSKRVVRGMGFIKKGTAIFALSFRHGKIYQPMCS